MEICAYQTIRMLTGPYRGEKGEIVPPLPRGSNGKYYVRSVHAPDTFPILRKDFLILKGEEERVS